MKYLSNTSTKISNALQDHNPNPKEAPIVTAKYPLGNILVYRKHGSIKYHPKKPTARVNKNGFLPT